MDLVIREAPCEGVVLLRLNRPEKLNALSIALRRELAAQIEAATADGEIGAIVIAGNERAFAAGADLGELIGLKPGDPEFDQLRVAWNAMGRCPKPIVAAIRGVALGGGFELALQCDLIVAGERARFGLPEAQIGIVPGAGGMQRLSRLIGRQRAMLWLVNGGMIDAATAEAQGLCAQRVADESTESVAIQLAAKAAGLSPQVIETVKRAMRLSENSLLDDAIAAERPWFEALFGMPQQQMGMAQALARSQSKDRKNT